METVKWLSGGLLALLAYVVVSNSLYLLVGARFLQCLPGVNIRGFRGTIKIAVMLALTVFAVALWLAKRPLAWMGVARWREPVQLEISRWVGRGARVVVRVFSRRVHPVDASD